MVEDNESFQGDDQGQNGRSVLEDYNEKMNLLSKQMGTADFIPLTFQHTKSWQETAEHEKAKCIDMAAEGCRVVCGVVAPNATNDLFETVFRKHDDQSVTRDLEALMCAYRDAPSRNIKTQILSIYAYRSVL